MQILKYILIITLFISPVFSSPLDEKRVVVSKISDTKYKMQIFFNYENPYETQTLLRGRLAHYFVTVPIPDRFNVTSMRADIKYVPSLVLFPARSTASIMANENMLRQFSLNEQRYKDSGKINIKADIPLRMLKDYNRIGVQIIQHYSSGQGKEDIEDTSAPELWTQIDLQNSFIEFDFTLKEFPEKISSIKYFMFDNKNVIKDSVNFVFPKTPTEDDFVNYGFMANIIGGILKFRDIDFSVSTSVAKNRNNIVIGKREDLGKLFKEYKKEIHFFEKMTYGNINLIQNPRNKTKGFLVVTGKNQEEIKNALYRMVNKDLLLLEEQNIRVFKTEIPPPSKPFTTPGFLSTGGKVLLSELGYTTRTFFGETSSPLYLNFKLYPTVHYENSDSLRSTLNIVQGGIIRGDSATNIYLNEVLAFQVRTTKNKDEDRASAIASQRFELADKNIIPAKLLAKGKNMLKIEFAMVPVGGPALVRFNNNILKLTLRDDSAIYFPRAKTEIELPNLKYVSELAYPFSIYPDLRNTGILITDFDSRTISAAMYVAFKLGKMIDYPAYRLVITPDINTVINKDIIVVGSQIDRYSLLYKNAPIQFTKKGVIKEIALNSQFVNIDGVRKKQYTAKTKIIESLNFNDFLIAQTYQSPFNKKRVVLEFSSNNPSSLIKGIRNGLSAIHMGKFHGDTWLYNVVADKSYSFRLKETYILNEVIDDLDY